MASTTYDQKRFCEIKRCGKIDHLGNVPVMVRNAGELPQPFWLGAACGGGYRPKLGAGVYRPCAYWLYPRRYAQRQPHMGRIPPKTRVQAPHGGSRLHHLLHRGRFCPGVSARRVCAGLLRARPDRDRRRVVGQLGQWRGMPDLLLVQGGVNDAL